MFIYNVTTKVDHDIVTEWLQWQKEIHIPEIMRTGFFTDHKFYKLLEHDDEAGCVFVTQYLADSRNNYELYISRAAAGLRKKAADKWGEKVVSFRTMLQTVE